MQPRPHESTSISTPAPQTPHDTHPPSRQSVGRRQRQRPFALVRQKRRRDAGVDDVAPGGSVARRLAECETGRRRSTAPRALVEVLRPAVEAGAPAPGVLDQAVGARSPPRQRRLDERALQVVQREPHVPRHGGAQQPLAPAQRRLAGERLELERGVRLRHVGGDRDGEAGPAARDLLRPARGRPRHRRDPLHVVVGLAGQPDHEVQLQPREAAREHGAHRLVELRLVDALVDALTQGLRAGLGRKRHRPALLRGEPPSETAAESMRSDGSETRTPGRRSRMRRTASSMPE
jgi:hypothetical protein